MLQRETAGRPKGTPQDRSVPRSRVRAGDTSIDRRCRTLAAPAFLSYGFRPFFLGATVYAALAVPAWLWMYFWGVAPAGPFAGAAWHAHEMIFGYLGAAMAGFILTAVPNWTGRLPLSGTPLAVLFGLWVAGRIACTAVADPVAAAAIDLAFPVALTAAVLREVAAGRNWRNLPIALLFTVFAAASLVHHLDAAGVAPYGLAVRLALGVAAVMIALIGGRIVPSFTRNWLTRQRETRLPAPFGTLDRLAILATATGAIGWIAVPELMATGWLLVAGGGLLAVRLSRWQGFRCLGEPIVLVLHLGYLWLAVSLVLLGLSILAPAAVPESAALHALTAGAVATMTLAVMTRATLGHTGREIVADRMTVAIYAAVTAGAFLRVAAPFAPDVYTELLAAGGGLWSLAFLLFVVRYGPMLVTPRR